VGRARGEALAVRAVRVEVFQAGAKHTSHHSHLFDVLNPSPEYELLWHGCSPGTPFSRVHVLNPKQECTSPEFPSSPSRDNLSKRTGSAVQKPDSFEPGFF
jgi:hypothetical protein